MSKRSVFTLAALASAAMPEFAVASTRESEQYLLSGPDDIDVAVVTDTAGREFDVSVSSSDTGKQLLTSRAKASSALIRAKEPAGLGFALERTVAFQPGENDRGPTGSTAVLITMHNDGAATPLSQLTESQCVSVGTAIGAIHRLRPAFLEKEGYPVYSAAQIRQQLVAWIARLKEAGHVPDEITSSWERIVSTEGLWSFRTCPVHGGFDDGDMIFSSTGLNAIYRWSDMQVNDPARDLAWIFDKLDSKRRNNVLSAYARLIGSRLDDLIMLRASLWLQMEQVGEFIRALDRADNDRILEFKAHVERLAHQLSVRTSKANASKGRNGRNPSTITVGTLLDDGDSRNDGRTNRDDDRRVSESTKPHQTIPDEMSPAPAAISPVSDRWRRDDEHAATNESAGARFQPHTSPQRVESNTIPVEPPNTQSNDEETMALPKLRPEDFDDDGNLVDTNRAATETDSQETTGQTTDTKSNKEQERPAGYVSLIDKDSVNAASDDDSSTDAQSEDADGSTGEQQSAR
ncbi:aminoglycoside phosphotransferase [Bifidobacterium tissieri]|uniref:Aminoglycoside phosphotransferase n=1 Tax=Bifidobacterium tissieri TaxID=1630162 RepID=A0A261F946_9BIFI|nr:phosphotransferase [Bifidobacterium tissieri]OZG55671.1 aminoglycoside phosphotransferase [Bifidobacterium tissieri]